LTEASSLHNCQFLASDTPEALYQAAVDLDGLDAVVLDDNVPSNNVLEALPALKMALSAKGFPSLWNTQPKSPKRVSTPPVSDPTVDRAPSLLRRLSDVVTWSAPKAPTDPSGSTFSSPRSPFTSLFASDMSGEPEDYFASVSTSSSHQKHGRTSSFDQLTRSLSKTFSHRSLSRSQTASDISRSDTVSSLASSASSNSTTTSPYKYSARCIVISDRPSPALFSALDKLSAPSSRVHLEDLVAGFQARHGLEFDHYCLWTGNWDHLAKEKTRPAYTRRARSGKGEEKVDKASISLVKTRFIK
jgi:hypothetical protein